MTAETNTKPKPKIKEPQRPKPVVETTTAEFGYRSPGRLAVGGGAFGTPPKQESKLDPVTAVFADVVMRQMVGGGEVNMPKERSARPLRQATVRQLQAEYGNRYVQKRIHSIVQDFGPFGGISSKSGFPSIQRDEVNGSSSGNLSQSGSGGQSGFPSLYWSMDYQRLQTDAILRESITLEALATHLYGDPAVAQTLASINNLEPNALLSVGQRLQVTGVKGKRVTAATIAHFHASPIIPADVSDPAGWLTGISLASPEEFPQKKRELDEQLEADFQTIINYLDFPIFTPPIEDSVISIIRRWAEERFTANTRSYPNGGDYLDKLFRKLSGKSRSVSSFTEETSSYYSLIFNRFRRASEVKLLRDTYSKLYKEDSGFQEMSFGSFFWEQVKEGHVRDWIYAGGKGMVKGFWGGIKGTASFLKTAVTDPEKAWEQIKNAPGAMKKMWENRGEIWKKFANASSEEQAEMIGEFFGGVESGIAMGGASGFAVSKLAQASGWIGKIGKTLEAVTKFNPIGWLKNKLGRTKSGIPIKGKGTTGHKSKPLERIPPERQLTEGTGPPERIPPGRQLTEGKKPKSVEDIIEPGSPQYLHLQKEVINSWKRGGSNRPVKVVSMDRGNELGKGARGYITQEKFVVGRTPAEIEQILGLQPGTLKNGAYVARLSRTPKVTEFELKGYTQLPGGKEFVPGGDYPPGLGAPQWNLTETIPTETPHFVSPNRVYSKK